MSCLDPMAQARHSAGVPDFSGPGFSEARRIILIAPEDSPVSSPDTGDTTAPDSSNRRSQIAGRMAELTEEISTLAAELAGLGHEEAPPDSTDGATGEAMELD